MDNTKSDLDAGMNRLIWAFAVHTCPEDTVFKARYFMNYLMQFPTCNNEVCLHTVFTMKASIYLMPATNEPRREKNAFRTFRPINFKCACLAP